MIKKLGKFWIKNWIKGFMDKNLLEFVQNIDIILHVFLLIVSIASISLQKTRYNTMT